MVVKGIMGGSYLPLSESDIVDIHAATMKVLQKTGIAVHCKKALEILDNGGAKVNYDKMRAYIPESLVEECLNSAPSKVTLCGRDEKHDLELSDKNVYLGTGGTALNVLDLDRKRRLSNMEDLTNIARLVDALENISFFVCPVYPSELDKSVVDVNRFYGSIFNTTKHVMGGVYSIEGVRKVIKIAEEIAGGPDKLKERPFISMITCIMSPLKFDKDYTELMIEIAKYGLPLATPTAPLAGATAPLTLAGTLVQLNAEALTGIVLTQLVNKGTPVLYSAVPTTVDVRTMAFLFGSVEMGIMNAAASQLARHYKVPIYATAGVTDSKIPDVQSGYEKASTAFLAALAGANYIHDAAGLLEGAMTAGYAQYVIDNEIIGMALRAVRGIEVNPDTLAVDIIDEVGPGGDYLGQQHTMNYMRTETYFTEVADRQNHTNWFNSGSKNGWDKADELARKILETHRTLPIPRDIHEKIKNIAPEIVDF